MKLDGARILVTGAAGGIGRALALELSRRGARIVASDRDAVALRAALGAAAPDSICLGADLSRSAELPGLVESAAGAWDGLDALINVAGVLDFAPLGDERPEDVELTFRVNVLAPVLLVRAALPHLRRSRGRVVNVGSIFGSIAFPWFATYSASKFAVRGFSEALRRELHEDGVGVTYVAPRATRTSLASSFGEMAAATRMPLDAPELVAARIADALARDRDDVYLGGPEPFFVRLNGLLPRLVDRALRKQARAMAPFAVRAAQARLVRPATAPQGAGKDLPCVT
jgi:NAD(P)-dependent dehydrogenase (short-subunit alcohol dehydrogenase family)